MRWSAVRGVDFESIEQDCPIDFRRCFVGERIV